MSGLTPESEITMLRLLLSSAEERALVHERIAGAEESRVTELLITLEQIRLEADFESQSRDGHWAIDKLDRIYDLAAT